MNRRRKILGMAGARRVAILLGALTAGCVCGFALNPALDISQYGHKAWTVRDGFSVGTIFAMAQTPDGYLWLGSEFGLFRFDGVRSIPWRPPAGQHLPDAPYSMLVTRDGTLWIGTFAGLASWRGGKLTEYPELGKQFVTSCSKTGRGRCGPQRWAVHRGPLQDGCASSEAAARSAS